MCFGYLERKLSSAGGFGRTCVAVDTFDFFNIKKKLVMRTHAALQYVLFYISCTVSCSNIVDSVMLSKHQDKQGHLKLIFVKDFPCKIEI